MVKFVSCVTSIKGTSNDSVKRLESKVINVYIEAFLRDLVAFGRIPERADMIANSF